MQWVKWGIFLNNPQRISYWTYQRHSHFSLVSHAMSWSVLMVRSVDCQHPVSYNNANNRERWAEISELCLGSKKYKRMPQLEKSLLLHFIILTAISPLLPDISKEESPCSSSPCGLWAQCHNFSSGSFICKCDRNGDYPFGTNNIVNQFLSLSFHSPQQETLTSSAMRVTPTLSAKLLRSVTKDLVRNSKRYPVAEVRRCRDGGAALWAETSPGSGSGRGKRASWGTRRENSSTSEAGSTSAAPSSSLTSGWPQLPTASWWEKYLNPICLWCFSAYLAECVHTDTAR